MSQPATVRIRTGRYAGCLGQVQPQTPLLEGHQWVKLTEPPAKHPKMQLPEDALSFSPTQLAPEP